jgi:ABC-type nitrate/sulfonate/bicarbonate transport system substrate-binding protein
VPDKISPSYFLAEAAVELGFFKAEGLDVSLETIYPVDKCYAALRDGAIDFVGGAAHAVPSAFPGFKGAKLICAQAQGMYWFLVMRADLGIARGDLAALKGRRIGAAPWVEMGLRRVLITAGLDLARDEIVIAPVPGATGTTTNFGLTAAQALADGKIDGFWANGMATEIAVTSGVGNIVLDVRRGDGPAGCFDYTFGALATTERLIEKSPDIAEAALRALVDAQADLKTDVGRATIVGERRFPLRETGLIAQIIERDLPYYNAATREKSISGVVGFARSLGILNRNVEYRDIVATQFSHLWGHA